MKKILYISATSEYGGGPQHLFDLTKNLKDKYNYIIAIPKTGMFWKKFKDQKCELFQIPHRRFSLFLAIKLAILVKKNSIDIIHTHGKGGDVYGRFISFFTGVPLVYTPHGLHFSQYSFVMKILYFSYEKFTGGIIKKIIFVSDTEKNKAKELNFWKKELFNVIYNGIVSQKLNIRSPEAKNLLRLKEKEKYKSIIINLSRFNYQKNVNEIIEIAKEMPESLFCIIGHGEEFEKVKLFLNKVNLKNIYLHGFTENTHDLINISDIYLSTSRWEGMPLSIIEAMQLEKPIVASDVIGNKDLVCHGEVGFNYKLGNISEAVMYLNKILNNKELSLKMGKSGKRIQQMKYSIKQMVEETQKIYKELLIN